MPIDIEPDPALIQVLRAAEGQGFPECLAIITAYTSGAVPTATERSEAFVLVGSGKEWQLDEPLQFAMPRFGDDGLNAFAPTPSAAEMVREFARDWAKNTAARLRAEVRRALIERTQNEYAKDCLDREPEQHQRAIFQLWIRNVARDKLREIERRTGSAALRSYIKALDNLPDVESAAVPTKN